jgi:hypothetical protein
MGSGAVWVIFAQTKVNQLELILPPKVTGYYDRHAPAPGGHEPAFRQGCQLLAEAHGLTLQELALASPGNYWVARFAGYGSEPDLEARCNLFFPLMGFFRQGAYADLPAMARCFPPPLVVLPAAFLATKLDSENEASNLAVSRLHDAEFAQFAYREPHILADIVFHRWD